MMVVIWYAIIAGLLCYLGIEAIARTGYLLVPFVVVAIVILFGLLSRFCIIYQLAPWQGNGLIKAFQEGFHTVGFNFGILGLVLMAPSFKDYKTVKRTVAYSLTGVVLLKCLYALFYILVFGITVGAEKTMPFFEMGRLVYINQNFQRIEALFIVIWVFCGLLAIAASIYVGMYLVALLLKLPAIRPLLPIVIIVIINAASLPSNFGIVARIDSRVIQLLDIGIYVFPIVLFILAFLKKRRTRTCAAT